MKTRNIIIVWTLSFVMYSLKCGQFTEASACKTEAWQMQMMRGYFQQFSCVLNCTNQTYVPEIIQKPKPPCTNLCTAQQILWGNLDTCNIKLNSGCYALKMTMTTKDAGSKLCNEQGMELASLETKAEMYAVSKFLTRIHPDKNKTFFYWVSGIFQDKLKNFAWRNETVPIQKELWLLNEPNGMFFGEHCNTVGRIFGVTKQKKIGLSDFKCNCSISVLCEKYQ